MLPDPSSAQSIGWIILAAGAAMAAINQGHALIRRASGHEGERTISPNPLNVRAEPEYVMKKDFDSLVADKRKEMDQLHARLGGMERGIRDEMKRDVAQLHEKINGVGIGVARVETEQHSQNKVLSQLHEDIKEIMRREH